MKALAQKVGESTYLFFRNHLYSYAYENIKTIRWSCYNRKSENCSAYILTEKVCINGEYQVVDIRNVHLGHKPNGTEAERNRMFLKNEMQQNLDTMNVNRSYESAILKHPHKAKHVVLEEVASNLYRRRRDLYYPPQPVDIPDALNIFNTTRFKYNLYQSQHELKKLKLKKQNIHIDPQQVDVQKLQNSINQLQLQFKQLKLELENKQCIMDIVKPWVCSMKHGFLGRE